MARRDSALLGHLFRDRYQTPYADTSARSAMVSPRAAETCAAARRRTWSCETGPVTGRSQTLIAISGRSHDLKAFFG
jgi:hypothetical protein